MNANTVGPVFTRVWNTPDNGYAERFKHTIEPFMNIQRTTAIDDYNRIIKTDSSDSIVGNSTSYTYGLSNRVYAKRRVGTISQAQEIVTVDLAAVLLHRRAIVAERSAVHTAATTRRPRSFRRSPSPSVRALRRRSIQRSAPSWTRNSGNC